MGRARVQCLTHGLAKNTLIDKWAGRGYNDGHMGWEKIIILTDIWAGLGYNDGQMGWTRVHLRVCWRGKGTMIGIFSVRRQGSMIADDRHNVLDKETMTDTLHGHGKDT